MSGPVKYQLFATIKDDRESLSENGQNSLLKIPKKPVKKGFLIFGKETFAIL